MAQEAKIRLLTPGITAHPQKDTPKAAGNKPCAPK